MRDSRFLWSLPLLFSVAFAGVCAPAGASERQAPAAARPAADATGSLAARAENEFQLGQADFKAGRLESAKDHFNRAFNLLLSAPAGVHSDERLEREFDKIVESVNAIEMAALKRGEGLPRPSTKPTTSPSPSIPASRPKLKPRSRHPVRSAAGDERPGRRLHQLLLQPRTRTLEHASPAPAATKT
jgi:hypothetical protein